MESSVSAAVDAMNELAGQDTEAFFDGVTMALTKAVKQHYERRLKAETEAIRQAYDDAIQLERRCFQSQLQALGQSLGDSSPSAEAESFRDASQIQNEMTRYLRKEALSQECAYSPAIATMLQEVLNSVQLLNDHCKSRLRTMTATFCPRGLTGKEYPLQVRPTEETVKDVKQKIRAEYCKTCEVKLCSTSDGHVEMDDSQLLMHYNLDQEFTVILVDVLHSNELAHLSFEDPKSLAFDSVTQKHGLVLNALRVEAVNVRGKAGVNVTEDGCLLLPKPVTLHESGWTLSCWILAPIHGGARASARHLLDGGSAEERVMVALVRGKLRNIAEGNYLRGFNISTLSEGWHHLAVVGKGSVTTYWMDGRQIAGSEVWRHHGAHPSHRKFPGPTQCLGLFGGLPYLRHGSRSLAD